MGARVQLTSSYTVTILFPYRSVLLIVHSRRLLTWRGRGSVLFLNTAYLLVHCCTRSARHGTLFPFPVLTLNLRFHADGRCRAVQARLCRKCCGHIIGLGPYLLSMTSLPSALVAVSGFSSFHFRFAPLISTPFAIRRW